MKKYLLPEKGHFYKANLHCHSTFSDGRKTVEQHKEEYLKKGYSVIAFSDHEGLVPHIELTDERFLALTAVEIGVNDGFGRTYHLNFFSSDPCRSGLPTFEKVYGVEGINNLIAAFNDAGFLCQYNHPRWSQQVPAEFVGLEGLWGFEIYNHGCEVEMNDGWGDYEFEVICRYGKNLPAAVATDDNHNVAGYSGAYTDSFGGFSVIKAEKLTYDSIFDAMKRGDIYASTGPEIYDLYVDGEGLHVKCSPVSSIHVLTDTRRTWCARDTEDALTEWTAPIDGGFRYIRLELKDTHGRKALTRAYSKAEIYD